LSDKTPNITPPTTAAMIDALNAMKASKLKDVIQDLLELLEK
jgi:hypothetical protein